MTWLLGALAHGLAAAGTALIAKALWPKRWKDRKPASCIVCMATWGALAVQISMMISGQLTPEWSAAWVIPWGLNYLGSVAVCVYLLGKTTLFLPPMLPLLGGSDGGSDVGAEVRDLDSDRSAGERGQSS